MLSDAHEGYWRGPHRALIYFLKLVVKQRIAAFEIDDEGHWRAVLQCGHPQHVRHDPPLTTRGWVLTEEGRASRIGIELDCKRCDDEAEKEED